MLQPNSTLKIFKNANELAQALAVDFQEAVNQAAKENRDYFVALSGGSTPVRLFQQLASPAYRENIDWKNVHFFWGDERCVPPDHPDSNYGMTKKYLFDHISIPHENIHRINGENDPETEAKRYAGEIFRLLPLNRHGWPQFDWILLGLGNDGHTASIFPGSPILKDRDNICAVATHPQIGQKRITLTLLVINATKRLSFLVSGENKASIAANILTAAEKNKSLPATFVRPENGALEWYLDQPAAAKIRGYYES